jgi:hypothetical protein
MSALELSAMKRAKNRHVVTARARSRSVALTADGATSAGAVSGEPPAVYFPSCGAICDVFWWARRKPAPAAEAAGARDRPKARVAT